MLVDLVVRNGMQVWILRRWQNALCSSSIGVKGNISEQSILSVSIYSRSIQWIVIHDLHSPAGPGQGCPDAGPRAREEVSQVQPHHRQPRPDDPAHQDRPRAAHRPGSRPAGRHPRLPSLPPLGQHQDWYSNKFKLIMFTWFCHILLGIDMDTCIFNLDANQQINVRWVLLHKLVCHKMALAVCIKISMELHQLLLCEHFCSPPLFLDICHGELSPFWLVPLVCNGILYEIPLSW